MGGEVSPGLSGKEEGTWPGRTFERMISERIVGKVNVTVRVPGGAGRSAEHEVQLDGEALVGVVELPLAGFFEGGEVGELEGEGLVVGGQLELAGETFAPVLVGRGEVVVGAVQDGVHRFVADGEGGVVEGEGEGVVDEGEFEVVVGDFDEGDGGRGGGWARAGRGIAMAARTARRRKISFTAEAQRDAEKICMVFPLAAAG